MSSQHTYENADALLDAASNMLAAKVLLMSFTTWKEFTSRLSASSAAAFMFGSPRPLATQVLIHQWLPTGAIVAIGLQSCQWMTFSPSLNQVDQRNGDV